jgi:hypothetical protein
MIMAMAAMIIAMVVIMSIGSGRMNVVMGMFMQMFMGMGVRVIVGVRFPIMLVVVVVLMGVIVVVQMRMIVLSFHGGSPLIGRLCPGWAFLLLLSITGSSVKIGA